MCANTFSILLFSNPSSLPMQPPLKIIICYFLALGEIRGLTGRLCGKSNLLFLYQNNLFFILKNNLLGCSISQAVPSNRCLFLAYREETRGSGERNQFSQMCQIKTRAVFVMAGVWFSSYVVFSERSSLLFNQETSKFDVQLYS